MRRPVRLVRLINAPKRLALSLPFPTPLSGALMPVSFRGRKTGILDQQPVSYIRDGDTLLTPGGGKWKLNLHAGQPTHLRLGGRGIRARPEIVRDVDVVDRLLRRMTATNPRVTSLVPVTGPDGQIDRSRVAAAACYGFRIIRWQLDEVRP